MKKALLLLVFFTCAHSTRLFSQGKLLTDSTYLSIQSIKNDSVRRAKAQAYMVALMMKKDPKGVAYSELLLKEALASGNEKYIGVVYSNTGAGYLRTGEYNLAYANFIKALPIFQKINEPFLLIRNYQNMAWIQIQLKDDGAENTVKSAIKVAKDHDLKNMETELYSLLGVVYDSREEFDKAIAAYKNAINGEKYATKYALTSTYLNLGISYRRSKRYNEALESFLKGKKLAAEVNDKSLNQSVYQNLAELTLAMKDYDGAEKYVLLAYENSKNNFEPVLRRGLYENLKNIYEKKGEFKKALAYDDSVVISDKQVFAKDKVASVRDLQTKYETAIKDQKIQQQIAENLQEKQLLVINQKQAQIQKIDFIAKQNQLEGESKLQASLLQKNKLQARLDKQESTAQIFKQSETIKSNNRLQAFLLAVLLGSVAIAGLIFYNQRKTKSLNKVITSQKDDLEKVNAVKDRMFSIIGHDMRSPINTLIAFNTLLEEEELSANQMKLYSTEIKKTLDSTSSMMNNLLNWANSQMQGYKPELASYQLKDIADVVVSAVKAQAGQKDIIIKNEISPDVSVFADNNMTELILRNLITNSIKFTPKGGTITLNAEQAANQTRFSVTDSGVGISPELVSLFNSQQADFATKSTHGTNKEKGTGLGLLLCKNFAQLMNGRIQVTSQPGRGSTFNVSLPVGIVEKIQIA